MVVNIDETLLEKAKELTGIQEKTALIHFGIETLIRMENSKRLARLGGSEKSLPPIPRRRPSGK